MAPQGATKFSYQSNNNLNSTSKEASRRGRNLAATRAKVTYKRNKKASVTSALKKQNKQFIMATNEIWREQGFSANSYKKLAMHCNIKEKACKTIFTVSVTVKNVVSTIIISTCIQRWIQTDYTWFSSINKNCYKKRKKKLQLITQTSLTSRLALNPYTPGNIGIIIITIIITIVGIIQVEC